MSDREERELELKEKSCVKGVPQYQSDQANLTIKILK